MRVYCVRATVAVLTQRQEPFTDLRRRPRGRRIATELGGGAILQGQRHGNGPWFTVRWCPAGPRRPASTSHRRILLDCALHHHRINKMAMKEVMCLIDFGEDGIMESTP